MSGVIMKKVHGGLLLAAVIVVFLAACATMQSRWEAANSADTITAYEDFLKRYPEGDFTDQARLRQNDLYEDRDWREAEANNTVAAYEDFLKNHPHGKHMSDAYAKLEMLSPPKASVTFLKQYQRGGFMDEALLRPEKPSVVLAQAKDTLSTHDEDLNRYSVIPNNAQLRRDKLTAVNRSSEWGTIVYPKSNTNLRANRSWSSKLKGQLKTGQPVKVDFLQDDWYAVFPVTQKQRNLKKALGYVYAPLLIDKRVSNSSGPIASEEKSAKETPLKYVEMESPPIDVMNITFKSAGNGQELLFVEFDRFYTPTISGIEGKEPRIILEIKNVSSLREDLAIINTGGNFIQQIRSSMDSQTRVALIVLDMVPEKDYFVTQTFYKKENLYSLAISEKKEIRRR
jgi:uncharacterized protein YgiM (DUF1202 family)